MGLEEMVAILGLLIVVLLGLGNFQLMKIEKHLKK